MGLSRDLCVALAEFRISDSNNKLNKGRNPDMRALPFASIQYGPSFLKDISF